jgi:hypothetical protein
MFSDLVGSTALSARMDPEDLREVISAKRQRLAKVRSCCCLARPALASRGSRQRSSNALPVNRTLVYDTSARRSIPTWRRRYAQADLGSDHTEQSTLRSLQRCFRSYPIQICAKAILLKTMSGVVSSRADAPGLQLQTVDRSLPKALRRRSNPTLRSELFLCSVRDHSPIHPLMLNPYARLRREVKLAQCANSVQSKLPLPCV